MPVRVLKLVCIPVGLIWLAGAALYTVAYALAARYAMVGIEKVPYGYVTDAQPQILLIGMVAVFIVISLAAAVFLILTFLSAIPRPCCSSFAAGLLGVQAAFVIVVPEQVIAVPKYLLFRFHSFPLWPFQTFLFAAAALALLALSIYFAGMRAQKAQIA